MPTRRGNFKKTVRCLVIQLTRLGDSLQSLMALRAAKQLYPELEIHFLVKNRFSEAAKKIPWIKEVITLPTDELLEPLLRGDCKPQEVINEITQWIKPLTTTTWDFAVNWSYSESSSYLTALIPARVKLGYSRSQDISFSSVDGWSNYIQAIIQGGSKQNIHLTDILTTQLLTALQIHIGEPSDNGNSPVTSKTFFDLKSREQDILSSDPVAKNPQNPMTPLLREELSSRKWIGIQLPGTTEKNYHWSTKNWAKLASLILKNDPSCHIALLGESTDQNTEKLFLSQIQEEIPDAHLLKRLVSLVGKTDFDLWASVVGRCHWILAENASVIHLASVLGTRVMTFSTSNSNWFEKGPYGNGHYLIVSNEEGQFTQPEVAYSIWRYAMNEWSHQRRHSLRQHLNRSGWDEYADSIQVYRSKIRNTQEGGGVNYESQLDRPFLIEDWAAIVTGHIARAWYCGWVPPIGQEISRLMINPQLMKGLRELKESSDVLLKICEEARRTALTLKSKSTRLRSEKIMNLGAREELKALRRKLIELETLIDRLGKTHFLLLAFARMSKVLMQNIRNVKASNLGHECAESYQLLTEGVKILRAWITYTLNLAKPTSVLEAPMKERHLT